MERQNKFNKHHRLRRRSPKFQQPEEPTKLLDCFDLATINISTSVKSFLKIVSGYFARNLSPSQLHVNKIFFSVHHKLLSANLSLAVVI